VPTVAEIESILEREQRLRDNNIIDGTLHSLALTYALT
jgi:hypothetical protein